MQKVELRRVSGPLRERLVEAIQL
eukprot:SAG31_NODE_16259_length_716_cov_1.387358_1_plen_23_part_10